MWPNPFLAQQLQEERVKDALRKAEQARLVQVAKGTRVAEQVASHGLLIKIRELGLPLVSAHHIKLNVEGV